jgi:hypothetical protein
MPSSPITAPTSPIARDYVEFGKKLKHTRQTLEWACARRRMMEKAGQVAMDLDDDDLGDDGDLASEEDGSHEAVTPPPTSTTISPFEHAKLPVPVMKPLTWTHDRTVVVVEDEEVMNAALALCGLGQGRS